MSRIPLDVHSFSIQYPATLTLLTFSPRAWAAVIATINHKKMNGKFRCILQEKHSVLELCRILITLRCTCLYSTTLYCSSLHFTVFYVTLFYTTLLYLSVLTVLRCNLLYFAVSYFTSLHSNLFYCAVSHCTLLCSTVLYCTSLQYISAPFTRSRFLITTVIRH